MSDFKSRLRELRVENNFSVKQAAEAVGLVPSAICNYEAGIREPSIDTILKFCDLFNVSADYLLGRKD